MLTVNFFGNPKDQHELQSLILTLRAILADFIHAKARIKVSGWSVPISAIQIIFKKILDWFNGVLRTHIPLNFPSKPF